MGALRDAIAIAKRRTACAVLVGFCCCTGAAARPRKPSPDPWQVALAARGEFESQPIHTRMQYSEVMDRFRAVYHDDPASVHAPAAITQVAELLAEQGRELHDEKSLHSAAGQYAFLIKAYPASSWAARARTARLDLVSNLGSARASAPVEASAVRAAAPVAGSMVEVAAETPAAKEPANTAPPARVGGRAMVSGIRHWSTPTYTRVAIDLGEDVQYEAARVEHPDRIFFDLHHARLAPELVGKSFSVNDDGFLTRIRAAQYTDDVTRVVLDVHEVTEYSAFLLPNPSRLIIDIHGTAAAVHEGVSSAGAVPPATPAEEPEHHVENDDAAARTARQSRAPAADGSVSRLPPMPVTDGSATFGLSSRTDKAAGSSSTAAAPRVVIPVKPTPAKPVPNTVASRSASTGTDVAAVSDQPGKVEATAHPTSSPVVSRNTATGRKDGEAVKRGAAGAHIKGEPAAVPPPMADGDTSLLRTLGLKIGRIVIDAGHGGHDSGTLGVDGLEEKDVVLDVALRLGKLLHQRLGAEIVYTRADDTFIPLETRTAIANKAQADLFISIHANSSADESARGVEVYYLNFTSDPDAMRVASRENAVSSQSVHELSDLVKKIALKDKIEESRELASDVDTSLYTGLKKGNQTLKDRGVKKAPFVVLIGANMPSILAEISFVTNPADAAQLRTPDYRQRVAESLFGGVARYAGAVNGVKSGAYERASGR